MTDFRLLAGLASRIIQSAQICLGRSLKDKGLGSAEANVLQFLYTNGDGVRQDDIVTAIEVSRPAISRTVASLASKGYLTMSASSSDKRARIVTLTEKARREQAFIDKQYADMVQAASVGVPDEAVQQFIEVFRKVADNLDSYRREGVPHDRRNRSAGASWK